eukprot:symbB.v1.2.013600.t1/scaffold960.1/size148753/3
MWTLQLSNCFYCAGMQAMLQTARDQYPWWEDRPMAYVSMEGPIFPTMGYGWLWLPPHPRVPPTEAKAL